MYQSEGVTFILIRPDKKILMQQRDDGQGKSIPYPEMWSIPGGEKEEKETPVEAVVREVKEEYNITISENECEYILSYNHDNTVNDQIFVYRVPQDIQPELREGKEMKWMTIQEIKTLPLAWQIDKVLPEIEKKLESLGFKDQ